MKRRNALFISRKWPPAIGGMESYAATLAESLATHYNLRLLVLPGRQDGGPPGLVEYVRFVLKAATHVILHAGKYDHLILGDLILFPAGLVSFIRAPHQSRTVVLYGLDLVYQKRRGVLPLLYGLFLKSFVLCQRVLTHKVAISTHTRLLAEQAGLRDVSLVIPSIPDSDLLRCSPSIDELPDSFKSARLKILYFGRLVHRKGAEWFASQVLPNLKVDADFFVVGSPTDPAYHRRLMENPKVIYLGRQSDQTLASLIVHCDVVVMPNVPSPDAGDAEGFGLVAVEAASLGAILVASRLQGITDAVIEGKTGILVAPGDVVAWTMVMSSLLQEPTEQKQARRTLAAATSREFYSSERLGLEFAALLK